MYAIVEIAGQQFKVEEGKKIFVHRIEEAEVGSNVEFDKVLLIDDDGKITIGEPVIPDFIVDGHILGHVRGDKVIVFKKKRKKGYRIKNGHRQNFTQVEIVSIAPKGTPKKVMKKVEPAELEAKPVVKVEEAKTEKKAATTKKAAATKAAPAEKKSAEKKPATVKKPAAKKPAKDKKE